MATDGTRARRTTLLTIGEFARVSRLSIKALRLYDESGLLPPVRIDSATGYRYYDQDQLERARLVAWLRRLGMPLARIRSVCDLCDTDRYAAAAEIRAFWLRVEADTAARRELADFLIEQLSTRNEEAPMPRSTAQAAAPFEIRYAALSDAGTVRAIQQDAAYAGPRLFAVADGFGEQGAPASAAAIDALRAIDEAAFTDVSGAAVEPGDLLNLLQDAVERAERSIRPLGSGSGTDTGAGNGIGTGSTLTALVWTGSRLGLVHIGDSRAYLLRAGRFLQITHDHTLVQSMLDEGRITPQEAESHPKRALLVKALGGGDAVVEPELRVAEVQAGDRYLLCTDGLSANVDESEIRRVVEGTADPAAAVRALISLAESAGGSDNVACVVADVISAEAV
jgi:PPM family protein phosphatase